MSLLGAMGVREGKPLGFLPSFPRLQIPDLSPRPCASCGSQTWQVGPDKEMVCNSCDMMVWIAWKLARDRRERVSCPESSILAFGAAIRREEENA